MKIMIKNIIFALLSVVALGTSHPSMATGPESDVAAVPAETTPDTAPPAEDNTQPAHNTRPINDNHVDYRYCLELKTDREIIECRYRKK
jgi:hypothetical protein